MAALSPDELVFRSQRRLAVSRNAAIGGLDYVEVERAGAADDGQSERWRLALYFIPAAEPGGVEVPPGIGADRVRILLDGGTDAEVRIEEVRGAADGRSPVVVEVRRRRPRSVGHAGSDEPVYELELVDVAALDPFFTRAPFAFVPGRRGEVMTAPAAARVRPLEPAESDYLAKDYESFRTLMLEKLAVLVPTWTERNPADLGVALVELLAYAGDYLSYYQDAAASEAYLRTCRRRVSVRRHAHLLDYRLHEGCNARVWVQVEVAPKPVDALGQPVAVEWPIRLPQGTQLLTTSALMPPVLESPSDALDRALAQGVKVFETLHGQDLHPDCNELRLYAWGAADFQLAAGTTAAALVGDFTKNLEAGAILVFEEALGPRSGEAADADPSHRHAVRLTACRKASDPIDGTVLTQIEWAEADALPDAFQVAARIGSRSVEGITLVRGNVVLADHGMTLGLEGLPAVPEEGTYRPELERRNLTHSVRISKDDWRRPASEMLSQDPAEALPEVMLFSYPEHSIIPAAERKPPRGERWMPRSTLLASGRFSSDFCVEVDDDRHARLRFGDGLLGSLPEPGTEFKAVYRIGNGAAGNVGPGAIAHVVIDTDVLSANAELPLAWRNPNLPTAESLRAALVSATNHLPAIGGTEREDKEAARAHAPSAFRTQARCVVPADYVEIAERHPEVLRAVCRLEWTGSWQTGFLYVQRPGGGPVDAAFRLRLEAFLAPYQLAGRELEVRPPRWVPLHLRLRVRLAPDRHREGVRRSLDEAFDTSPDGFFWPDRFGFGQPVYLSEVVAAASAVEGVTAVEVLAFHRWGHPAGDEIERGRLEIGELEIAALAGDPNTPQRGTLELVLEGGR